MVLIEYRAPWAVLRSQSIKLEALGSKVFHIDRRRGLGLEIEGANDQFELRVDVSENGLRFAEVGPYLSLKLVLLCAHEVLAEVEYESLVKFIGSLVYQVDDDVHEPFLVGLGFALLSNLDEVLVEIGSE